ncbi:MAG TPA: F0F1 ATP synthase subunit A [Candidatus Saccharimonadales bacterium]|nr:F0F1 ATP synthase subunit A [Candidatus Saccharimonadales bacterium]
MGPVAITNSILYGWISIGVMTIVLIWVARRITVRPKGGLTQFVEVIAEFIRDMVENGFEDKARGRRYSLYFVTLFFFLLCSNWLGLVPGVGDAITVHGVPLLRPFTADLDGTLAAATVTMLMIYGSSIREFRSVGKWLRHFFSGSPLNPIYFVIGALEMFSDLMRTVSLSLRLFLNIAIGEVIVIVFGYLGHIVAPLSAAPFYMIDMFEGALQAFIFTTLSFMYLAAAVNHVGHEEHDDLTETTTLETMGASQPGGEPSV